MNLEYGLKRVYQMLNTDTSNGLTYNELYNNTGRVSAADSTFLQVLTQAFSNTKDSKKLEISQEQLSKMIDEIKKQGLTYEQLMIMQSQETGSKEKQELINTILENFKNVDTNGDGRISQEEIDSFMMDKELKKKKEDMTAFKENDITLFYTTPSSTSSGADNEDDNYYT
jgi:DNA-binding transcriptional regulator YhcF (GntR family)